MLLPAQFVLGEAAMGVPGGHLVLCVLHQDLLASVLKVQEFLPMSWESLSSTQERRARVNLRWNHSPHTLRTWGLQRPSERHLVLCWQHRQGIARPSPPFCRMYWREVMQEPRTSRNTLATISCRETQAWDEDGGWSCWRTGGRYCLCLFSLSRKMVQGSFLQESSIDSPSDGGYWGSHGVGSTSICLDT